MDEHAWFAVTLREWLTHQRHEHTLDDVALHAAIDARDPAAVRTELQDAPFSPEQRRYLDDLLDRWTRFLAEE